MCTWAFIIGRLSPDTNGDRRQCRCLRQNQNLSSFFFLHKMHFYFCIQYHIKLFYIKEARHGRMRQRAYQKSLVQQKLGLKKVPKSLVKIGSVTAKILMILTNVTRTYVAWTNVTCFVKIELVTAEILLRYC